MSSEVVRVVEEDGYQLLVTQGSLDLRAERVVSIASISRYRPVPGPPVEGLDTGRGSLGTGARMSSRCPPAGPAKPASPGQGAPEGPPGWQSCRGLTHS